MNDSLLLVTAIAMSITAAMAVLPWLEGKVGPRIQRWYLRRQTRRTAWRHKQVPAAVYDRAFGAVGERLCMECGTPLPQRLLLTLGGPQTPCSQCGTKYGASESGYLHVSRPS